MPAPRNDYKRPAALGTVPAPRNDYKWPAALRNSASTQKWLQVTSSFKEQCKQPEVTASDQPIAWECKQPAHSMELQVTSNLLGILYCSCWEFFTVLAGNSLLLLLRIPHCSCWEFFTALAENSTLLLQRESMSLELRICTTIGQIDNVTQFLTPPWKYTSDHFQWQATRCLHGHPLPLHPFDRPSIMEIMLKIEHGVTAQVTSIFLCEVCTLSAQVPALVLFFIWGSHMERQYTASDHDT